MKLSTRRWTSAKTWALVSATLILASSGVAARAQMGELGTTSANTGTVPWIGIEGRYLNHEELAWLFQRDMGGALLIERVAPGSPAHDAGLRGGFVSAWIEGQELILGGDLIVAMQIPHLCRDQCLLEAPGHLADLEQVGVIFLRDGRLNFAVLDLP